ncbi:MAG: hypothetical protein Q9192_007810, partial [Flavoplaca navasiana]
LLLPCGIETLTSTSTSTTTITTSSGAGSSSSNMGFRATVRKLADKAASTTSKAKAAVKSLFHRNGEQYQDLEADTRAEQVRKALHEQRML